MSGAGSSHTTSSDFPPLQRGPEDFFISMFAESDTPSSWLLYPGKASCSMAAMRKDTHMISLLSPQFQPTLCSALNSTQRWAKAFNLPLPHRNMAYIPDPTEKLQVSCSHVVLPAVFRSLPNNSHPCLISTFKPGRKLTDHTPVCATLNLKCGKYIHTHEVNCKHTL